MTIQDAVDQLTPYVQHVLIKNKTDFIDAIHNYLQSKGFWGNILSSVSVVFVNNFFWTFVLTTVVPFILKVTLFVVIEIFAPYLAALIPFLNGLIDLIDKSILSENEKQNVKDVFELFKLDPTMLPVDIQIPVQEMHELDSLRDDLENYSKSENSLFRRPS